jgi:hypothetical protein
MSSKSYIDYAEYKGGVDELRRTGIASRVVLPFDAGSGRAVRIEDREYILETPVAESGPIVEPEFVDDPDAIRGYVARPV